MSGSELSSPVQKKRKRHSDLDKSKFEDLQDQRPVTPDAPALSHAQRRKRQKAEKLALQQKTVSKRRKLEDGLAVPEPQTTLMNSKRQNSVWVGNLCFRTTQANIKMFFESAGEITRIHLPTKVLAKPGVKPENRGFAYVDFSTPEAKAAAIALSEQPLLGRKLLIKDGDDFTGRPPTFPGAEPLKNNAQGNPVSHTKSAQKILRGQKQPPAPTLFIGNLGFEITEQDIRQLFEAHRQKTKKGNNKHSVEDDNEEEDEKKDVWIRKIRMGTFEDTGNCKGFAFIDFSSAEHATAALINPKNHHLNGRKLVVEYASADAVRRGAGKDKHRLDGQKPSRQPEKCEPTKPDRLPHVMGDTTHQRDSTLPHNETQGNGAQKPPSGKRRQMKVPRQKPGAVLAQAKRESVAIIPSQGQKIVF